MTRYRWYLAFLLVAAVAAPSVAGVTVIVDEDFDDYANDAAFYGSWDSSNGSNDAILTTDDTLFPGIQGQAVDHIGGSFNEWIETSFSITPTAEDPIVLAGDLYDDGGGNKRLTVGLRNAADPNILELGF